MDVFRKTFELSAPLYDTLLSLHIHRTAVLLIVNLVGKGKGKGLPITGHQGPEGEYRYSYTLSLSWALGGGWVVNFTPRPLYPRERDPTHDCTCILSLLLLNLYGLGISVYYYNGIWRWLLTLELSALKYPYYWQVHIFGFVRLSHQVCAVKLCYKIQNYPFWNYPFSAS